MSKTWGFIHAGIEATMPTAPQTTSANLHAKLSAKVAHARAARNVSGDDDPNIELLHDQINDLLDQLERQP